VTPTGEPNEITKLLHQLKQGNRLAEAALAPLIYNQLRQLARSYMRRERPNHTLQTTALVHEAYLRLLGANATDWVDRSHFFAVAASVMRRLLVDHARSKKTL
jgi:RNA polymerase sigma factor (TIGR02999 family)